MKKVKVEFNGWDFVKEVSDASWQKGKDNDLGAAYSFGHFVGFMTMAFQTLGDNLTQEQVERLNRMLEVHKK